MNHDEHDLGALRNKAGRALALPTISIAAGAFFGVLSGARFLDGSIVVECALMGAIVGVVASPALVWGMWYESGCGALALVMGLTAATAFLTGPLAVLLSTTLYVGLSIAIGISTRERRDRRTSGACPECEYSLVGLRGQTCPECGVPLQAKQ